MCQLLTHENIVLWPTVSGTSQRLSGADSSSNTKSTVANTAIHTTLQLAFADDIIYGVDPIG